MVNLRHDGAKYIFDAMGVKRAPAEFSHRAIQMIRSFVDGGERPAGLGGFGRDTTRIFAYAEYDIVHPSSVPAAGREEIRTSATADTFGGYIFRESGLAGSQPPLPSTMVLRAMRLPNSGLVDRTLCAEFQLLVEMCRLLGPHREDNDDPKPVGIETTEQSLGVVSLFTTHTPCMSCLGAIRQFQLMYPEIDLEVSEYEDVGPQHFP
mmetsp:Transcript_20006/g.32402  ORF Transcript_20006/g.32402 Transcript_20006/m.32402 type:complete len:207 (+) Transcript_20006:511-1131(+)